MDRKFTWDEEAIIIDFVKNHSVLFDISDPNYRNSAHKKRLWEEIGKELNRTAGEVQRKWLNVKSYHKKKKKELGSSGGMTYPRDKLLAFLDGFNTVKKSLKIQDDEEEILIDFVKNHPPLFDIIHPDYKCVKLRKQLWKEIAQELNKTEEEVQKRWSCIRNCHKRKKRGTGYISLGKMSYCDERLSFLNDVSLRNDILLRSDPSIVCKSFSNDNDFDNNDGHVENDSCSSSSALSPRKRKAADDQGDLQIALLKTLCERKSLEEAPAPDMLDRFFSAMCATVRAFPCKEQAEVKLKIANIIGETELRLQEEAVNDSLLLL